MECQLNSLDLPVIGEVNHTVGDCYCYLCTCGLHKCPSTAPYYKSSPNVMYSTARRDFGYPKPPASIPLLVREGELMHSKQPMDLNTIQRQSYNTTSINKDTPESIRSKTNSPFKFNANSTYRSNFPDWQTCIKHMPRPETKYTPNLIRFTGVSTYGQDFSTHKISHTQKRIIKNKPSLGGFVEESTGKTTNQTFYTSHGVSPVKVRYVSEDIRIPLTSIAPSSTYQQSFLPHLPSTRLLTKKKRLKMNLTEL
jgi:hypothetical protein